VRQLPEAKQVRDENNSERKLVADVSLHKEAGQSVIRKTAGARSAERSYRAGRSKRTPSVRDERAAW
jgi:hypothetical protein